MELKEWEKTYVPEFEVDSIPSDVDEDRVWTLISCDGHREILNGSHWVNSLNFIITENPYKGRDRLVIKVTIEDNIHFAYCVCLRW